MAKGSMALIDAAKADSLYGAMGSAVEVSGGSAANTIAGVASFGGKAAFVGRVRNDQLGNIFRHDIKAIGVEFETAAASHGAPTGRCLVFVTPDAQRTMQTFLGACVELGPADIDADQIARAKITYLEGYLWDPPQAKEAFRKAADLAHNADRKVALSLSDTFCVKRYQQEFLHLLDEHLDVLFANEAEIAALYDVKSFDDAVKAVRGRCDIAVLTRSEKGAVIVTDKETIPVPAVKPEKLVDTTGAGDLFAAGFLYGLSQDRTLGDCGRLGALAAAEIISHVGARPEVSLKDLAKKHGL
ncbi:MAG: adenosine kinase [Planctomycetes bacterium]|nr:adenosine kinase [Planctomycetota bacterium]